MRATFRTGSDELDRSGVSYELTRWSPVLLIILTIVVDRATPPSQRFDRVLSAAPALAAASWTVGATIAFGALAAASEVLLAFSRGGPVDRGTLSTTLLVIAAVTCAASFASRVRQSREREVAELTAVANTAQQVLLRPLPAQVSGVQLDLLYSAAAARARIGGDFYEALRTRYGLRVIVGDVQGKGLPAVETASVLLGSFREAAYDEPDLVRLVGRLETGMIRYAEQVPGSDTAERLATAVLLELPLDRPMARLLNCGHPPPLLLHRGAVDTVEPSVWGLPLNVSRLLDDERPVDIIPFGPGDRLMIYTDGVSETRDQNGTFYPLVERIGRWAELPSAVLLERLRTDLLDYGGRSQDDVAALLVGCPAAGASGMPLRAPTPVPPGS
jgi:hypothetical protein